METELSLDSSVFCIYFWGMISKIEKDLYNKLTREHQNQFLKVGNYFLNLIDRNIICIDQPHLKGLGYSAFHLYNDPETRKEFIQVRNMLHELHGKINTNTYPNLSENICDVIIVLSDPEALGNDPKYTKRLNNVWNEIVSENEALKRDEKFKKYLKKI